MATKKKSAKNEVQPFFIIFGKIKSSGHQAFLQLAVLSNIFLFLGGGSDLEQLITKICHLNS